MLIVTEDYDCRNNLNYSNVTALVVLGREDGLNAILDLDGNFERIYMRGGAIQIPELGGVPVTYSDEVNVCGISINFNADGTIIYAQTDGLTIKLEHGYSGDIYGAIGENCDFNLYCYEDQAAVLTTSKGDYGLGVTGAIRYEIIHGKIVPSYAIPKE